MGNILVKTPLTTNGDHPVMKDGRQVYTESILTDRAKAILEKSNLALPQHLKKIITDIPDNPIPAPSYTAQVDTSTGSSSTVQSVKSRKPLQTENDDKE